jgi:NitT/TauT family transport system ATP-binding protein
MTGIDVTRRAKIELRGVHLDFFSDAGEVQALAGIDLTIGEGEFVAVVGPSGCGKSTLLSLIGGLIAPTAGQVLLNGHPVRGPSREVGFMLQQDALFEWRTILDNVLLGPELRGRRAAARQQAEALLARYGLAGFEARYPRELSGGMRQRVALARTMSIDPDVLLLDEPFSALDSQTRLAIAGEVGGIIRSEKQTAVLVTHDIGEAIAMADRVVVLSGRPGRVRRVHAVPHAGRMEHASPLEARDSPAHVALFKQIWQELDVHVV